MNNYLLIVLDSTPVLKLDSAAPVVRFCAGSREFVAVEWEGVFYDWLRNDAGELIGVRFCNEPTVELRSKIESLSYVSIDEYGMVRIYFGNDRGENDELSASQDFGENELYRASDGTFAFIVDATYLGESDFARIRDRSPIAHVA